MSMTAVEALPAEGTVYEHQGRQYTVGEPVDDWGLDNLPLGTTVWDGGALHRAEGRYWIRVAEEHTGWARDDWDEFGRPQSITADYNPLRSCPWAVPDTLTRFRVRFADAVVECAGEFSEDHRTVALRILDDLGAAPNLIGSRVYASSTPPNGTVATFGAPDEVGFTIFRYDDGWTRVHGYYDSMGDCGSCVVTSAPGQKPPVEVEGDQEALIEQFKARVWKAGQAAKQEHLWCSAYDRLLERFGIVDPDPRPDFSGWTTMVKGTDARDGLPDSAVIGVDRGDWGIFVKQDGDWVRVAGTRPVAAGTMHLLFDGEGRFEIPHASALADFLPGAVWRGTTLVGLP
jgi:hypothetical protein